MRGGPLPSGTIEAQYHGVVRRGQGEERHKPIETVQPLGLGRIRKNILGLDLSPLAQTPQVGLDINIVGVQAP